MNQALALLAFVATSLMVAERSASACQCSEETAEEALKRASFIVEGTVIGEVESRDARSQSTVQLEDVRVLRGEPGGTRLSIGNGHECAGQTLETHKRYVIYLSGNEATMSLCSRVVEVSQLTAAERAALSVRRDPEPAQPSATGSPSASTPPSVPRGAGCGGCRIGVGGSDRAILWGTLGLIGIAWARRRSRRRVGPSPRLRALTMGAAFAASLAGLRCSGDKRKEVAPTATEIATAATTATLPATDTPLSSASAPLKGNAGAAPQIPPSMHSSWTELPRLHHARRAHTLSSLPDGGLVVIGGLAPDGRPIDSIEVLTLGASSWRVAGKLTTARSEHGAVVLLDGRVLAIGGRGDPTEHAPLVSTELFDPKTGLTTAGPPLVVGRYSMHPLLTPNGELWLADGFNDLGTAYPPQRLARGAKSFEETPSTGAAPSTAWIDGEGIVTVESGRSEAIAPIARYKRWLNAGRRPLQPVVAAIDAKSATELPHALPPLGVATSVSLGVDTLLLAQTSAGEWSAFRFEGKRRAFIELAPPPRDLLFTSIVPVPGGAVTCGEDHAWLFDGTAWKELPPPPKGLWNFPVTVTQGSVALVGGYDRNSKNQDHVTDRAAELHWTSTP